MKHRHRKYHQQYFHITDRADGTLISVGLFDFFLRTAWSFTFHVDGLLLEFFEMLLQVQTTIGAISIDFEPGFGTLAMEDVLAGESFDYLA